MWYSPTIDTRGRLLVDFLTSHGLLAANEKDGPYLLWADRCKLD
jgi:hypothetical protein